MHVFFSSFIIGVNKELGFLFPVFLFRFVLFSERGGFLKFYDHFTNGSVFSDVKVSLKSNLF